MASLADLLRYKKEIEIIDPNSGKPVKKVWIRVLGDLDLQKAYKASRIASSLKRAALRNPESDDYLDEVLGILDLTTEEKKDVIKTARLSNIVSEAMVAVERPELPKIEEIAVEPDAASLEEMENLDKEEAKVESEYQKKIEEYITLRTEEIEQNLIQMSEEELTKLAQLEISNLIPFSLFITELNIQKAFYGTFQDKACKVREFESVEDFRQLPKTIQDFIIAEINSLEVDGSEIKN